MVCFKGTSSRALSCSQMVISKTAFHFRREEIPQQWPHTSTSHLWWIPRNAVWYGLVPYIWNKGLSPPFARRRNPKVSSSCLRADDYFKESVIIVSRGVLTSRQDHRRWYGCCFINSLSTSSVSLRKPARYQYFAPIFRNALKASRRTIPR